MKRNAISLRQPVLASTPGMEVDRALMLQGVGRV